MKQSLKSENLDNGIFKQTKLTQQSCVVILPSSVLEHSVVWLDQVCMIIYVNFASKQNFLKQQFANCA